MRLAIVTDAWRPQTNGVVTTLEHVVEALTNLGVCTTVIHPGDFARVPLPGYPEIEVAANTWRLQRMLRDVRADHVHIATEGPVGLAARRLIVRQRVPFTTSLHTKFPEYAHCRFGLPVALGYRYLRWFHAPATGTFVTTASHRDELGEHGLRNLVVWGRGVDTDRFRPRPRTQRQRPLLLYVGRVAIEKNLEAFLDLPFDAAKVVVGDGPQRASLAARFPQVRWVGYQYGDALVGWYADADVLVFPSRTDTFGLVMLEAMACGTPVAAFPVTGPKDIVVSGVNGALHENLATAVHQALAVDRARCRAEAERHDWQRVAERLLEHVTASWPATTSADAGGSAARAAAM